MATKFLSGKCSQCGGTLEFPADAVGTTADCPHCGQPTELLLATPPQEQTVPAKTIVYTVIAILILIGGLIAAMLALKRAERIGHSHSPPVNATPASPTTK